MKVLELQCFLKQEVSHKVLYRAFFFFNQHVRTRKHEYNNTKTLSKCLNR